MLSSLFRILRACRARLIRFLRGIPPPPTRPPPRPLPAPVLPVLLPSDGLVFPFGPEPPDMD